MDKQLNNSVKFGLIGWVLLSIFTFLYGGIYNQIMVQGMETTFKNIFLTMAGSVMIGFSAFQLLFATTLIIYYLKRNKVGG